MPWRSRLFREAIVTRGPDFDLLHHVSLQPAFPPDYDVPGIVAITFRLRVRENGTASAAPGNGRPPRSGEPGWVFVTAIDPAAALRLGARIGLDAAESLAMVDSHERMHVELQLAGVPEEVEEARSLFIDAVWLSLRHEGAEALVRAGEFGLVSEVGHDFWERLVDTSAGER